MTANYLKRLEDALWDSRAATTPRWKGILLQILRTLVVLVRDISQGQLTLRAMSLVYTTFLSLVPLLALSFSVLKAFGVHNQIQPMLQRFLEPLGEESVELTGRIILFIGNMNVGVLGSMGLVLLIYTSVSLVQKIEEAFNVIWRITRSRSLGERLSRYLSLLVVGPPLVFSALGITATVMNAEIGRRILDIEPFGQISLGLSRITPYLLVMGAFTFAYYFIPNTRVRPAAALVGGSLAGLAWQSAGWGFARFVASSGQYAAIYSSFAILILFMIWLYLNWMILLVGAGIAFYYQHPEYLALRGEEPRLSNRMRERLALGLMSLVAGHFLAGRGPLSTNEMARNLRIPAHATGIVLDALERQGLLVRAGTGPEAYLPARAPETISLREILETVRSGGEPQYLPPEDLPLQPQVQELARRMEEAMDGAVAGLNLKNIAAGYPVPPHLADPSPEGKESYRPAPYPQGQGLDTTLK